MNSGWEEVKLGDVAEIVSGGTPDSKKKEYWDEGNILWATLPDLKHKYLYDTERKITYLGLKKSSAKLLPINTVIFSSRATIGEVSITKAETSTNQGSKNFICDPTKIYYEFLYYLLKNSVSRINLLAGGATYKEINKTVLSEINVTIPNLHLQRKIAQILSNYDELIENNTKRIELLEKMAKLIYEDWFAKFKFPGHEKIKLIDSKTEFGKIPEGWEVKKIGEEIIIPKGKNITKSTVVEGNVPVVAAGLNPACYHNQSNAEAPVFTISASGANAGFIRLYHENIWASDCSYINKKITPFVYYYYSVLSNMKEKITALQRGSAQPHVYPADIMNLEMVNPPEKLILKFEEMATNIFQQIKNLSLKNQNLRKTRELLLPKLISGEINVSKLNIKIDNGTTVQ